MSKHSEHNLEYDLLSTAWMLEKVRNSNIYMLKIYMQHYAIHQVSKMKYGLS